jgi:tetratricopeptide (TPR) repeat protein
LSRKARRAAARLGQAEGARPQAGMPVAADAFRAGLAHHQAGRLGEAEARYRETLAAAPDHADALHLLGVLASQVGRHDVAVDLIDLAIRQDGKNSLYHSNRGLALHGLRRFEEALAAYDRALALRPNYAEALFNRAVTLQALARFEEALATYGRALALRPDHVEALCNRGVVLEKLGRFAEALTSYDRALAARPTFVEALGNRGNALAALGRRAEALASYDRALEVRPDHAEVLSNRGNTLRDLGRREEALASYDRALAAHPEHVEAQFNRAGVLHDLGRLDEALASYERALEARPDLVKALFNCGVLLQGFKRREEALAMYERALNARPDHAEALCNRGVVLHELGRLDAALDGYERALALRPDYAEALLNRGNARKALQRFADALESYDGALKARPDYAEAWSNRGVVLQRLRRFDEAVASFDRALVARPDFAEALNNRADALQELGRFDEALACYDRALALASDYAEAGLNRALLLLLSGAFAQGWAAYEWRRKLPSWASRSFAAPEWSGEELGGKRLLLHAEQGFGDTIQFVRYARLAAARGARVVLEAQPPLEALLAASSCAETVLATGAPLPPFDLHCPLLSLPRLLGTTAATIPADIPYIRPPPERLEAWRAWLPHDAPLIGLAWSGHPANSKDHDRSIPFAQLAPLLRVPGVRFVSLQKDVRASDAAAFAGCTGVIDLRARLNDFADTAAVIAGLDLIITVDTAVAHLAGAMGKPVWVLLPAVPDFRWLLERADSAWYPSARLFRKSGDWDEVVARVARELAAAVRA